MLNDNTIQQNYLPFIIELRTRLIRCCLLFVSLFLFLFWQDETLFSFLAKPFLMNISLENSLIATDITSTLTVPMKIAFITTAFMLMPWFLYEIWSFIAPGLYKKEKQNIVPILAASILLFYLGAAFAYFIICPMALNFFSHLTPKMVKLLTDIRHYLDFMLTLILAGGLAFQVPIITIVTVKLKLVSHAQLAYFRPYIIVLAFVLGMLLTPPDVISQIMLALPMWGLFEVGLLFCKRF